MKTRKWPPLCMAFLTVLCFCSCQDWGEVDAPAGNQKLPPQADTSAKLVAEFTFDTDFSSTVKEGETPLTGEALLYTGGQEPEIVEDPERNGGVIHLKDGYLRIPNPLKGISLEIGASLSFWVKAAQTDPAGALISFTDGGTNHLYFTSNAFLSYTGTNGYLDINSPEKSLTHAMPAATWHYVALAFTKDGYAIYIDGAKKYDTNNHASISSGKTRAVSVGTFDYADITDLLESATYLYIGYGSPTETKEACYDDLKVWTNTFSDQEAEGPGMGEVEVPDPAYQNTFDTSYGLQIIGAGSFITVEDAGFGKVFQNVASASPRQNYLLLPENVLSHSTETQELSIGVWVNARNAGESAVYAWAPLFTAYGKAPVNGANETDPWPVFLLEYRCTAEINWAGWCTFTDAQNSKGVNTLYHYDNDWLKDKGWHYYTAVFTTTSGEIFIDGVSANQWTTDGTSDNNIIAGLFSAATAFKYICLGGNQGYGWGDNDPGFQFDELAIYNKALTVREIQSIIKKKK